MIPHDLTTEIRTLPATGDHSIVLISGVEPRHLRFAYRMQAEFGPLVKAWYQFGGEGSAGSSPKKSTLDKVKERLFQSIAPADVRRYLKEHGFVRTARRSIAVLATLGGRVRTVRALARRQLRRRRIERQLLEREIGALAQRASLRPIPVADPNAPEVVEQIRALDAYFLLTLGGPLYRQPLLESVRGVAINQHAGWSPDYKGCDTIEWALYNRNLDAVGSTVHLTTSGADAGPILRRSHACLVPGEPPEAHFVRVVALGTELMVEVVRDIISDKRITIARQPPVAGRTYVATDMTGPVLDGIERDFERAWCAEELARLRHF